MRGREGRGKGGRRVNGTMEEGEDGEEKAGVSVKRKGGSTFEEEG